MVRRRLAEVMQVPGPVIEGVRLADEGSGGDLGVGVEGRQEGVAVEAVHAAAEPEQAVEDVLPVQQFPEAGELVGVAGHCASP